MTRRIATTTARASTSCATNFHHRTPAGGQNAFQYAYEPLAERHEAAVASGSIPRDSRLFVASGNFPSPISPNRQGSRPNCCGGLLGRAGSLR
jgi:hypothetical protein